LTLSVTSDLTDRKRLEQQFLRSQRLESIGALASGIAHDINNVLAPILMTLQLFRPKLPDAEDQELLDNLETSANRGAEIVRQVLKFARGSETQRVPCQLRGLILDLSKLVVETFPRNIRIETQASETLPIVKCDQTQIYQVLMNLAVNSRDAMPQGGQLTIAAQAITIGEEAVGLHPEGRPGSYVLLSVTDSGSGMSSDTQSKIFKPFFSTKEPGSGTGLGLSTSWGIVRHHGGFISVNSQLGLGTEMRVYLPAFDEKEAHARRPLTEAVPRGSGETILVVDDEATIRIVTKATLEDNGYKVLVAGDGTEAIAVFARHAPSIAVVVTDMLMPYLDGPSTVRALQKLDPAVKVIGVTGAGEYAKPISFTEVPGIRLLAKPFASSDLLLALAQILGKISK
jgi:two-component system cell cycle sensor histidine kinase/response regulator CckA